MKNNPTNEYYYGKIDDATSISKSTQATYKNKMEFMLKLCNISSVHELLTNPTLYMGNIASVKVPLSSQCSALGTILAFFLHSGLKSTHHQLYATWFEEFKKCDAHLKERTKSNIPTEKQSLSVIDWGEVLKVRDRLPYASERHVLLSIYSYMPPRRQMDYAYLRIYVNPDHDPLLDHNHFHLYNRKRDSAYMFISEYKTAKRYKDFLNTDIPQQFIEIVKASLLSRPREFMFTQRNGERFKNATSFQKYSNKLLKTIFGNDGFTVNSLRHSFASKLSSYKDMSLGERETYALKMGHSVERSYEYVFLDEVQFNTTKPKITSKGNNQNRNSEGRACFMRNKDKISKIDCPS